MQVILAFKWHYWQGRKRYSMPYKNNSDLGKNMYWDEQNPFGMKKLWPLYASEPSALLWNMHQFWKDILCQGKWNIANCPKYPVMALEYCVGLLSQALPWVMSEIMESSGCVIMLTWQKQALCEACVTYSHYILIENATGSPHICS